jgi:hypothetical protein
MNTTLALTLALCLPVLGCTGSVPAVEILEATPDTLSSSDDEKDDLTITVRYSDPDGDLGQGVARIFDCRAEGIVTDLPIPRIANDDGVAQGAPIQGDMALVLADVGEVAASEAVPAACADLGVSKPSGGAQAFCVVLIDTAGNESDGACTGPITVGP